MSAKVPAEFEGQPEVERCPRCDYPLIGLPATHRCPECGLAYDHETRIWRATDGSRRLARLAKVMFAIAGVGVIAHLVYGTLTNGRLISPAKVWFGFIVLLLAAVEFCATVWAVAAGPFIAVEPDGFYWRLRGRQTRWVPWSAVQEVLVQPQGARRRVQLVLELRPWKLDVTSVLSDPFATERFVTQVRARQRAANSPGAPTTAPARSGG